MSKRKRRKTTAKVAETKNKRNSLVDIVIPVHNCFKIFQKCLDSIPDALDDIPYTVIIVDNASNKEEADEFYSRIKEPNYKIIRNRDNFGFPKTCNQGVNHGYSQLVFFLNSDVVLEKDSVKQLISNIYKDGKYVENIGIVGMKLLFPLENPLPNNIRPPGKVQHIGLTTNIRGDFQHIFIGWSADNPKVNKIRDVMAVTGAALLTRRDLFNKAGRFSEEYGKGTFEDVDFSFVIRKMGYNIVVDTKSIGYHYTNATGTTYGIGFPMQRNKMIFLQRWGNQMYWDEWRHW
jgi:O-antigen biosynthesis protein